MHNATAPYLWQWSCWLDHWIVSLLVWLWTQETRHYPRVWNTEVANSLCAHLFSKIKPQLNMNLIIEGAMTVCWKRYDNRAIGSKIGIFLLQCAFDVSSVFRILNKQRTNKPVSDDHSAYEKNCMICCNRLYNKQQGKKNNIFLDIDNIKMVNALHNRNIYHEHSQNQTTNPKNTFINKHFRFLQTLSRCITNYPCTYQSVVITYLVSVASLVLPC